MKLGDVVTRVVVDPRKLVEYALNPDNPVGRHKARMFERTLGFTRDNHSVLLGQIERAALDTEARLQKTDIYGDHYAVDIEIMGTLGRRAVVCTGWLVVRASDTAWLTTLYVRKEVPR